jgi:alpha-mannosidase
VLTAVKKAEDANGLIFRVVEWAGKDSTVRFTVPPGAIAATETDLMEHPVGGELKIDGNSVQVPIKPYEILSLRVDYGK